MRAGWAIILLFAIVTPLFYAAMLALIRTSILDEMAPSSRLHRSLEFLYRDFKPAFYLWEVRAPPTLTSGATPHTPLCP